VGACPSILLFTMSESEMCPNQCGYEQASTKYKMDQGRHWCQVHLHSLACYVTILDRLPRPHLADCYSKPGFWQPQAQIIKQVSFDTKSFFTVPYCFWYLQAKISSAKPMVFIWSYAAMRIEVFGDSLLVNFEFLDAGPPICRAKSHDYP